MAPPFTENGRGAMKRRGLLTGAAAMAAYAGLEKHGRAAGGASLPPYAFQPTPDNFYQTLKQLARTASARNPLNSGVFSGATAAWYTTGTLTQQYTYLAHPGDFAVSGGQPANASGTFFFASNWLFPGAGQLSGVSPFNVNTNPNFYYSANVVRVRFMTSAAVLEWHGTWYNANSAFSVIVDGQYLSPPGGIVPTANGGVIITFTGRGEHEVEIASTGSFGFRGIYLTNVTDDIWLPAGAANDPLVVFDGDSYSAMGGVSLPLDPDACWNQQLAFRMGWRNCWQTAVSSTGYLSIGNPFPGGALSTMRYRLENGGWLGIQPKVIVAAGGYNDVTWIEASSVTQAQVVAEAILYWQSVRAHFPNVLLFVLGPFGGRRGPDAATLALENAFKAAVLALGDPKTFFIPVNTATPDAIQYGTGNVSSAQNNGNADWSVASDQTHPSNAGHAHIAMRVANMMRPIIYAL